MRQLLIEDEEFEDFAIVFFSKCLSNFTYM